MFRANKNMLTRRIGITAQFLSHKLRTSITFRAYIKVHGNLTKRIFACISNEREPRSFSSRNLYESLLEVARINTGLVDLTSGYIIHGASFISGIKDDCGEYICSKYIRGGCLSRRILRKILILYLLPSRYFKRGAE